METATSAGRERPVVDAEAALRFLADASSVLARSLDYEDTLQRVANLLVPRIADWAGIDILEPDGSTRQLTTLIEEPELQAFLLDLRERYRQGTDQSRGTQSALHENRSIPGREPGRGRRPDPPPAARAARARPLRPAERPLVHDRPADSARADAWRGHADLAARRPPLRAGRPRLRGAPRTALRAGHRQRPPLRRGRTLARAAGHAVRDGSGRACLLRPRTALHAHQRRLGGDQRAAG